MYIYDFFAGKGQDMCGVPGSPLILLNEARGKNNSICQTDKSKKVVFAFNDNSEKDVLEENVAKYISECKANFCKNSDCSFNLYFGEFDFKKVFCSDPFRNILFNKKYAKFILLDQFGFSQVDDDIFKELTSAPYTDFIFFIASSFIQRFKNHPAVLKYFNTSIIEFDEKEPIKCHKSIAEYFVSLLENTEYYIHHFTIKKGTNYYGLIFGSGHTLGMEKFLRVCWSKDEFSGESSEGNTYNHDFDSESLFYTSGSSNKIEEVKSLIKNNILTERIKDNIAGLKFALKHGCQPKVFVDVVKELEGKKQILRKGDVNDSANDIHKIKKYSIERISQ